jgi:hypothetical protein
VGEYVKNCRWVLGSGPTDGKVYVLRVDMSLLSLPEFRIIEKEYCSKIKNIEFMSCFYGQAVHLVHFWSNEVLPMPILNSGQKAWLRREPCVLIVQQ